MTFGHPKAFASFKVSVYGPSAIQIPSIYDIVRCNLLKKLTELHDLSVTYRALGNDIKRVSPLSLADNEVFSMIIVLQKLKKTTNLEI